MKHAPKLVAKGLTFPETPRWHAGRQAWYFVDIDEGALFELGKLGEDSPRLLHRFEGTVSGVAFDDRDGFYVTVNRGPRPATVHHLQAASRGKADTKVVADLSDRATILNDMARGPSGHLYVGAINFDARKYFEDPSVPMKPGRLHRIDPATGAVEAAQGDVLFPNGIVITPDSRRLLMADSYRHRISAWNLDPDGSLGAMSVWAQFGEEDIVDGICLDREGALWIAAGRRVMRVLEGGTITDEIRMDGLHLTACMLGGPRGSTLLLTGAASIDRRIVGASATGVLHALDVRVPGGSLPSIYAP